MNIGLIGGGAIASFLLEEVSKNKHDSLNIKSIYVRDKAKYSYLSANYDVKLFSDITLFLESDIDIVVEAANIEAVATLVPTVLQKKDIVIISIGALANEPFLEKITALAETYNRSILLPSGGIGGLDLLQSAQAGEVTAVSLTTRKPATSLDREEISEEKIIFEGNARGAIKQFPTNMNISIILSLAGIGMDKTSVTIISDPNSASNIHEIEINGKFGKAIFKVTNDPMKENPKTSYLAALSVLSTLKKQTKRIKIGF